MKIGIDARSILNPEKNPAIGVGHYTYQLIRHLLDIDKENEYTLLFDYRVRQKDVKKFSRPNVEIKYFPWSDYKKYMPGAYSEILGMATLNKNDFDVLHTTSPDARVPLGYRGKVICTFQDLAIYKYPELFPKVDRIRATYNRRSMSKKADKIIAVSENTKKDLQGLFELGDEKIIVIKNGIDERFLENVSISPEDLRQELLEKFAVKNNYILFIGTLEPIKNVTRLLQAFKIFLENQKKNGVQNPYQLVVAGKKGWLWEEYRQLARDLEISDNVRFPGYVEGDDLHKLLKGAKLFVMPSLYEGFGMTVLEALATGTPSLISDIESLRQNVGNAAEYANPLNSQEMAEKMEKLVKDKDLQSKLKAKGQDKAKEFSWNQCAIDTLKVYEEVRESVKTKANV